MFYLLLYRSIIIVSCLLLYIIIMCYLLLYIIIVFYLLLYIIVSCLLLYIIIVCYFRYFMSKPYINKTNAAVIGWVCIMSIIILLFSTSYY